MAKNPTIVATITAEDKTRAAITTAMAALRELNKATKALKADLDNANMSGAHLKAADAAGVHLTKLQALRTAFGDLTKAAATYAAFKLPHIAKDAVDHYKPTEKEERGMQAAANYSREEMAMLREQRRDLAERLGEQPHAVVEGQNAFARRSMDAATTKAMTDLSAIAAKALGVSIADAAKLVEGVAFGSGLHIKSPEDVKQVVPLLNAQVLQAKKGAMTSQDIEDYGRLGVPAGRAAGLPMEVVTAIPMTLKRDNIPGAEAGVFTRAVSGSLSAPTQKFEKAALARGVQLTQFTKGDGLLNVDNLNSMLVHQFGVELSKQQVADLKARAGKGEFRDANPFIAAGVAAYEAQHGEMSAKDKQAVSNAMRQYHKYNRGKLDTGSMLDWLLTQPSEVQIAAVGPKQAGRLAILSQNREQFEHYREDVRNASPTLAEDIAKKRTEGMAAALDRAAAAYTNAADRWVEAATPVIIKLADLATAASSFAAGLSDGNVQMLELVGGMIALKGTLTATSAAMEAYKAILAALSGSAPATTATAASGAAAGAATGAAGGTAAGAAATATEAGAKSLAFRLGEKIGATLPIISRLNAALGPLMVLREIGEAKNPMTPEGYKTRLDLNVTPDMWEKARRAQAELKQGTDMEAARGRHMMEVQQRNDAIAAGDKLKSEAGISRDGTPTAVKVDTTVKGEVTGEASLHQTLDITTSPLLDARLKNLEARTTLPMRGKLGDTMTGSNGTRLPGNVGRGDL